MTATFLVEIEVVSDDMNGLIEDAADMLTDLEGNGWPVNSVKPWARPTSAMPLAPVNLTYPQNQQPPQQ